METPHEFSAVKVHPLSLPRITFGIIVLNGEPFTRYCLRQIYPYAHEIIAVEGAVPSASAVATPDGHSTDGTLQVLRDFQRAEDPDHKLIVVTAEDEGYDDGFWPGEKDEQSRAYATRATGDYLWQVDIDEFYQAGDIERVMDLLREQPDTTAVSFRQITFWGGFDYIVDGWYLRTGAEFYHRLFRWGEGFRYAGHRPPTVVDDSGRDLRTKTWISGKTMAETGIFLYHYSLLFPKQVREKCSYYGNAAWAHRSGAERWARDVYLGLTRPYRVHNVYEHPSWLKRFEGSHPEQIQAMRDDLMKGRIEEGLRRTDDIEALLESRRYALGRRILELLTPMHLVLRPLRINVDRVLASLGKRSLSLVRSLSRAGGRNSL